jgi:FkbM family methyltransferase
MSVAAVITRSFESLNLRGAPTLLHHLSRFTPNATATVDLPGGQTFSFPAYDPYWARHFYAGLPYEPDVEAIFRKVSAGRVLIDCGANIGYWSARAAELGFIGAIAIEANSRLIPFIKRNFDGPVHHAAVYSRSGETVRLGGDGATGSIGDAGVPVTTIALADLGISQPCVVKLDVEGSEIPAIEGAKGLDAIYVYEDWPKSGMLVTKHLLDDGYSVSGFDGTAIRKHADAFEFNERTNDRYGPSNFVAIRE